MTPSQVRNAADGNPDDRTALMAECSIGFDGRRYDFRGYHYDRLEDAVAYARLAGSRHPPPQPVATASLPLRDEAPFAPSAVERRLMAELDILFAGGAYHFAGYRYDRLDAAAAHARLLADRRQQART